MAATWTALTAEIADRLNRDDLVTQIVTYFIPDAEARLNRVLNGPQMEATAPVAVDAGTATLPANFLHLKTAYVDADPIVVLQQVSLQTLRDRYPNGDTGTPRFFAIQSDDTLLLGPAPDTTVSIVINYLERIPALGEANPTNWLLTSNPDIYTAACMVEGWTFLMDEDRATYWQQVLRVRVAEFIAQAGQLERSKIPQKLRTDLTGLIGGSFNINRGY